MAKAHLRQALVGQPRRTTLLRIEQSATENLHARAVHGHVARTWRAPNPAIVRNSKAGFAIDKLNNGIDAGVENVSLRVAVAGPGTDPNRSTPGSHTSSERR